MTTMLDLQAAHLADAVAAGTVPATGMTRHELTLATLGLVQRDGAVKALGALRSAYANRADRHETLLTFLVWSADRLLTAGLDIRTAVWHPLLTAGSEFAWWDRTTFFSVSARRTFVAPTLARPGDPTPGLPVDASGNFALAG